MGRTPERPSGGERPFRKCRLWRELLVIRDHLRGAVRLMALFRFAVVRWIHSRQPEPHGDAVFFPV